MASITLTVPNAVVPRITNAIGYSALLPDGSPNPVTPSQAIKDFITNAVKDQVRAFENPSVSAFAIAANDTDINSQINIT